MERILEYLTDHEADGLRIEQFLRRKGYSRQCLARIKQTPGGARVNGEARYLNQRLTAGDRIRIRLSEEHCS